MGICVKRIRKVCYSIVFIVRPLRKKSGAVFPAQDFVGHISERFYTRMNIKFLNRFIDLRVAERDAYTFGFDGH